MKLIIDIPDNEYKYTCERTLHDRTMWDDAIRNGTPLDDVKAEIAKPQDIMLGRLTSRSNAGILQFGGEAYDKGVKHALEILDNIGKTESEDKECKSE